MGQTSPEAQSGLSEVTTAATTGAVVVAPVAPATMPPAQDAAAITVGPATVPLAQDAAVAPQTDSAAGRTTPSEGRTFSVDFASIGGVLAALVLLVMGVMLMNASNSIIRKTGLIFMLGLAVTPMVVGGFPAIQARGKLFGGIQDFFVSTLWAWGTILVQWLFEVESTWVLVTVMACFVGLDAVLPNQRFLECSVKDRLLISLARTLIGVTGVIMTFVALIAWICTLFGLTDDRTSFGQYVVYLLVASWSTWLTKKYFEAVGVRQAT